MIDDTQPGVTMFLVVPAKKSLRRKHGCPECSRSDPGTPDGTSGCGTGFPNTDCHSETCGRLWVLVTPRSASKKATGLELIEVPRSACSVSWPGWMFCFRAALLDQSLGQLGAFAHAPPSSR